MGQNRKPRPLAAGRIWRLPAKNVADRVTRRASVRRAADPGEVHDDLISTDHAAALLGFDEAFVIRRARAGTLPAVRLPSGRFLVPEAAVRDLADSTRIEIAAGSSSDLRAARRGS